MCGIFGWIRPTAKTPTDLDLVQVFERGLIETQVRGTDATGYYAPSLGIVKEAIKAEDFVKKSRVVDELGGERFVLGHCRAASSNTSPESRTKDINAHPFESKNWVLIHNGTVSIPKIKGYPYTSEGVDSEIILSYVERHGIKAAIKNMRGSATLVLYNKASRKIFFWTDDNKPLALAYYHDMIFFASTRAIIRATLKFKTDLGIFPKVSYATIYEYELLKFDLTKGKFSRKGEIKPDGDNVFQDDDDDDDPLTHLSYQYPSYRNSTRSVTIVGSRPNLPRGSNMNPPSPSTHKIVRVSASNPPWKFA